MIEIKPLQLHQVTPVKRVILTVGNKISQVPEEAIRRYDAMSDIIAIV